MQVSRRGNEFMVNTEKAFVYGNEFIVNPQKAFVYGYWKGMKVCVYGKALVFEFAAGHYSLPFLFGFLRVLIVWIFEGIERVQGASETDENVESTPRARNKRSTMALLTLIMNIQHIKK